ncbi:MAG: DUF4398 domain-containing protein [Deltaproteobacteria bacterium]|nr:DUF4398 domain-containing protein [Deltaproteobacteria bacterium]
MLLLGAALALATGGCIGTLYAVKASSASSKIETARTLGAEHYAPFEYYYAKEHLDKASEEAAAAQYGEAINFAEIAQDYADKAIALSRAAHQGAGR